MSLPDPNPVASNHWHLREDERRSHVRFWESGRIDVTRGFELKGPPGELPRAATVMAVAENLVPSIAPHPLFPAAKLIGPAECRESSPGVYQITAQYRAEPTWFWRRQPIYAGSPEALAQAALDAMQNPLKANALYCNLRSDPEPKPHASHVEIAFGGEDRKGLIPLFPKDDRYQRQGMCGYIPPTLGYAPCMRPLGHDGPCAHALTTLPGYRDGVFHPDPPPVAIVTDDLGAFPTGVGGTCQVSYTLYPTRWAAFKSGFYRAVDARPRLWPWFLLWLSEMFFVSYFHLGRTWWNPLLACLAVIPLQVQLSRRHAWRKRQQQQSES